MYWETDKMSRFLVENLRKYKMMLASTTTPRLEEKSALLPDQSRLHRKQISAPLDLQIRRIYRDF